MLKTKILKLLSILLIIGLIFGTMPTIFAEEGTSTSDDYTSVDATVSAGITPDSILYVFDKLLENIQITLTIDEAKKTLLLMTISEERLAEAEYLIGLAEIEEVDEDAWNLLMQSVVDDYRAKVDKALEITEELAYETDEETKIELDKIIEIINSTVSFDSEALKNSDQINEIKNSALLVANVVSGLDKEKVEEIRALGVGYGQISQIFALAEATGEDLDVVAALFTEGKMGLGQATVELGIKISDFAKNKNSATSPVNENNDANEDLNNEDVNAIKLNNAFNNNGNTSENQSKNQIKGTQNNEVVDNDDELDEDNPSDDVDNIAKDGNESNNTKENNNNSTKDNNNSTKDKTNNNISLDINNNSKANGNSDNSNSKNR